MDRASLRSGNGPDSYLEVLALNLGRGPDYTAGIFVVFLSPYRQELATRFFLAVCLTYFSTFKKEAFR
jgi:hypothetical protein